MYRQGYTLHTHRVSRFVLVPPGPEVRDDLTTQGLGKSEVLHNFGEMKSLTGFKRNKSETSKEGESL